MMVFVMLAALATATCEGPSGRSGADQAALPLFADGRSVWVVSVPDDAARPLWYAAEELQATVKKISGATLGIVKSSESPKRNAIVLATEGDGAAFADVFSVRTEPGRISLTGNTPRGVLMAAYAFLRERLGCRWYWPGVDGEYLPTLNRFDVDAWEKTYRPYFPEREMSICGAWRNRNELTERWFPKVFLNSGGRTPKVKEDVGFIRRASGHHISLPLAEKERQKCFAEHPDWFSLLNGERSFSGFAGCWSNPEYFDYLVSNLTARIRSEKADIANFFVADIIPRCQCAACTADPDKSARFWNYYAKLIEAIRREIPGQRFAGLAYQEYRPVPNIKVQGVDYVDYCQYNRCYYHLLGDANCALNAKSMTEFRSWRQQAPLGLFGYEFDVYRDPVYVPMWDVVADEMRVFREMELRRVKTEISVKIGNVGAKGKKAIPAYQCGQLARRLSYYCWAMLAFDPDLDPKVLVRDFCDHVYGPGADAMFAYHLLMARTWLTMPRHISYFLSSARTHAPVFLSETVEAEALARLEAAAAATKDSPRAAAQVKLDTEAFGVWQRYVREAKKDGVIHELAEFSGDAYNMVPWLEARAKKGRPQGTQFKLYRGKDALHLLVDCKESEDEWFSTGSATNDVWKGTTVEIFIDTGDFACRQLAVMPAGGVWDAKEGDLSWNSGATVRPTVEKHHWQLDVTLPYAGFGGKPKAGDRWKFMVIRNKNVGSKKYVGCGWPINAHRDFSAAATLVFK